MKLKNVKVGQTVKIKEIPSTRYPTFEPECRGLVGTVVQVESLIYTGDLTVCVEFPDGGADWGNHKDIKLIEDVD